ncbi:NAC domain-containing protein 1-like [Mangifera indica]|uniref:NAC domain-containing protein 1-like n=1 Tax=Mangifera indica TaxID=29780 RepID=UPI001CFB34A5|nr:NAC domain-containing protein 1-like [Mangifera indica]
MEMAVGYRFKPFDDELVKYLLARVKGDPLPRNPIIECDLYGENTPWELFDEASDEKIWYCFTRLKKKGKRVFRTAGGGTWHGENSGIEILDRDNNYNVIGVKKTFSFKMKKVEKYRSCKWIMHEISLVGAYWGCDLVLCKIKKKHLKGYGSVAQICLQEKEDGACVIPANTTNQVQYNGGFLTYESKNVPPNIHGELWMNGNLPLNLPGGYLNNNDVITANNNNQPIIDGEFFMNNDVITANNNNQPIIDDEFFMNNGVMTANNNYQLEQALQNIEDLLMNDNEETMQCNDGLQMNDNLLSITDGGIRMNYEESMQCNDGIQMSDNFLPVTDRGIWMNNNSPPIAHGGFSVYHNLPLMSNTWWNPGKQQFKPNISQGEEAAETDSLSTRGNFSFSGCVY